MRKFISKQSVAIWYALSALFATYIVGQVILWCFPDRSSLGTSLLFILMNCVPLIMAAVFSLVLSEVKSLGEFFKKVFLQKESPLSWILALFIPVIYYGISFFLRNVSFTGNTLLAFLLYFPWTFLYGGLEEVGWRWFLQEHLYFSKHFITKMMVLSLVWFLWHIPIYQLPWITAGSSNYLIYYGISILLMNVRFTGNSLLAFFLYLPWTFLYGGPEEVGWRWFLQDHLSFSKHFIAKMMVLSIVWFLWHIPIYQLPWITAVSSNYLIFYLMILGNTFLFGALKEYSKGAAPCILAHMLIDSLAVLMLVQSSLTQIILLVICEILLASWLVAVRKS